MLISSLNDLPQEIRDELTNPQFRQLKHYSRATYSSGCHGPLCRKIERERNRRLNEDRAIKKGYKYTPFYDIRVSKEEEERLQEIIDWYLEKRDASRLQWLKTVTAVTAVITVPSVA